ncbi:MULTISPECIES: CsbD family protein [unclassified Moraxella]|uniref:CsbD family protein n=1 Tax=unclassified Moraxella TaxID=2685852 RepID=UPI003AF438FE
MNSDRLQGKWEQLKGEAKQQWGELTDDDMTKLDGKTDSLIGALQERYGHAKEMIAKEVNEWLDKFDDEKKEQNV